MSDADAQRPIDDPVISIGVLAQRVGLSVSAVRKYENEGLIIAHRTDSGHRLFSLEDIKRVRNIQHMIQDLGLNIEGIRRMQALLAVLGPASLRRRDPQELSGVQRQHSPVLDDQGARLRPPGKRVPAVRGLPVRLVVHAGHQASVARPERFAERRTRRFESLCSV